MSTRILCNKNTRNMQKFCCFQNRSSLTFCSPPPHPTTGSMILYGGAAYLGGLAGGWKCVDEDPALLDDDDDLAAEWDVSAGFLKAGGATAPPPVDPLPLLPPLDAAGDSGRLDNCCCCCCCCCCRAITAAAWWCDADGGFA